MGRMMSFGIVTKIKVRNLNLEKNKDKILELISSVFDLKYYSINEKTITEYKMELCLNEELFNKEFNDLLKELSEIDLFRYEIYHKIDSIKEEEWKDSEKNIKEKLDNYLNNNFDLKVKKTFEEKYDDITRKLVEDKENYCYYIEGASEECMDHSLICENYLDCTDMRYNDYFDGYDIDISLSYIPIYWDFGKTFSEDITATLYLLNHFFKKSIHSNLKNTLIFALSD